MPICHHTTYCPDFGVFPTYTLQCSYALFRYATGASTTSIYYCTCLPSSKQPLRSSATAHIHHRIRRYSSKHSSHFSMLVTPTLYYSHIYFNAKSTTSIYKPTLIL